MNNKKIKVLVVDDSALIRTIMKEIIDRENDMECVGAAPDPYVAREMIKSLNPDVLTLDVEMPKMDGLKFLELLMRLRPMPVIMVSTLTEQGSDITLRALELGAIDFVAKPKLDISKGMEQYASDITDKIRVASRVKVSKKDVRDTEKKPVSLPSIRSRMGSTEKIIVIGASTGGTEAVKEVLMRMPADVPAILVTQHMPENFTHSFAKRLDTVCKMTVKEAEDNERILPGYAYIAPGHSHLSIGRSGANYVTRLSQSAPVNRHRPSVDVLFQSAVATAASNALGVLLTGMGKDGAQGLLQMREAGSFTIAQDEQSCVVFGMPREAIELGAAVEIVSLSNISEVLLNYLVKHGGKSNRV